MINQLSTIKDVESLSEKIEILNSVVLELGKDDNEEIIDQIDNVFRDIVFFNKDFVKENINDSVLELLTELITNMNNNSDIKENTLDDVVYEIGIWENEYNESYNFQPDFQMELQEIILNITDKNIDLER